MQSEFATMNAVFDFFVETVKQNGTNLQESMIIKKVGDATEPDFIKSFNSYVSSHPQTLRFLGPCMKYKKWSIIDSKMTEPGFNLCNYVDDRIDVFLSYRNLDYPRIKIKISFETTNSLIRRCEWNQMKQFVDNIFPYWVMSDFDKLVGVGFFYQSTKTKTYFDHLTTLLPDQPKTWLISAIVQMFKCRYYVNEYLKKFIQSHFFTELIEQWSQPNRTTEVDRILNEFSGVLKEQYVNYRQFNIEFGVLAEPKNEFLLDLFDH